jgi:hypothetical protein
MKKILLTILLLHSVAVFAGPRTGHHGDFIVVCHKPKFMQEKPVADSQVTEFQNFEFMTSDNTDGATLKVWVNNKLIDVIKDKKPSGHYHIIGKLPEPIRKGKAWVKVTSESNDGCNDLRAWNVYIKK